MKKEIYKLLSKFFIVLAIIFALILYCELKLRDIPNSYIEKRKFLESKLDSIQVLILGSSHSYFGVNPDFLDMKGYNLAGVSQSLYYDNELYNKYVDKMPNLKIVLISISYFSLWYELYDNYVEDWRDYYYYHFWNIKLNDSKLFDWKQISFIDLYGTSFAQNAFRKNFKVQLNDYFATENGWFCVDPNVKLDTSENTSRAIITSYNKLLHDELLDKNKNYLELLLSDITNRKVLPVFIITPVYKTFSNLMDKDKNKITEHVINNLCAKYSCKYFNYLTDARFGINDFENPDHLNRDGAEKLSKIINEDIIRKIDSLRN